MCPCFNGTFGCRQQKPAEAGGNENRVCLKMHSVLWNPSGETLLASWWPRTGIWVVRDPGCVLDISWCTFSHFGFFLHICFTLPALLFLLWLFSDISTWQANNGCWQLPSSCFIWRWTHGKTISCSFSFFIGFLFFLLPFIVAREGTLIGPA